MMVIPWFNPLKNNGTCLVVYERTPRDSNFSIPDQDSDSDEKIMYEDIQLGYDEYDHTVRTMREKFRYLKNEILGCSIVDGNTNTFRFYFRQDRRGGSNASVQDQWDFEGFYEFDEEVLNSRLNHMHSDPHERYKIQTTFPWSGSGYTAGNIWLVAILRKMPSSLVKFYAPFLLGYGQGIRTGKLSHEDIEDKLDQEIKTNCIKQEMEFSNIILDYENTDIYVVYKK